MEKFKLIPYLSLSAQGNEMQPLLNARSTNNFGVVVLTWNLESVFITFITFILNCIYSLQFA